MPRRNLRRLAAAFAAVLVTCVVLGVIASRFGSFSLRPPIAHTPAWTGAPTAAPPPLHVEGNRLVTPEGEAVVLRGLMAPDPDRLSGDRRFNRDFYAQQAAAGANVIRVPVHPGRWVHDPDYLWRYLDPVVTWAGELGMYVILDWHYIGSIATGEGESMPDIGEQPDELTQAFWQQVAGHFKPAPHVLFEIWNEPAHISAPAWRQHAEQIVAAIRSTGATQVVIAGAVEWSRDLSDFAGAPLSDGQIAYAAHIYPAHSPSRWDEWFGELAARQPVLLTEWGYMDENRAAGPGYLGGDSASYAAPLLAYAAERGIGWVACWHDDEWQPPMYEKGMRTPTRYGQFVLDALRASGSR
jgi:hypothetical protein